ncbi:TetR/AcrR family transcriptional regulator [Tropicibacter sp. R15_0]|uniref:TetR/AcrR family transcriptional regulator n=1 Tax=Tropicibacter sp. R15_0 TaxID=2821101 RepID=UPI001ADCC537|nr:TetR/AcrR family transcriptional regulator [Tropicibacter sp. R15_0]MBO9466199.1 TetR/AcrR family transcriptional regulator [Tropicibacter sp. R15_0]
MSDLSRAPLTKPSHHHGNLRPALIEAGLAILIEDGLDKLTLRRCAARAGVSHAAPAHHFDGVDGLRAAIAEEGFRIFRNYMLDARGNVGPDPHERVKAICRGYIYFATDFPALFELMFNIKVIYDMVTSPVVPDSALGYDVLRDTCTPFVAPDTDPILVETQVWSLIHGYGTLLLAGRFGGSNPDAPLGPIFDPVMALLDQLTVHQPGQTGA